MFNDHDAHYVQYVAPDMHVSSSRFLMECAKVANMTDAYSTETPGQRLRRLRVAAGLTLGQIGEVLDSGATRIAHYEADRREMSGPIAVKIAGRLSTSAAYLLCLDNDQPVLSTREQQVIRNLRVLPPDALDELCRRIESLALIHAPVSMGLANEVVARSKRVSRQFVDQPQGDSCEVEPRTKSKARGSRRH